MEQEHLSPPTTVKEVGIHIGYIRQEMARIAKLLEDSPNRKEHDELEARVEKLETRHTVKDTVLLVGLVASALINIIALYNLFTKGGV